MAEAEARLKLGDSCRRKLDGSAGVVEGRRILSDRTIYLVAVEGFSTSIWLDALEIEAV